MHCAHSYKRCNDTLRNKIMKFYMKLTAPANGSSNESTQENFIVYKFENYKFESNGSVDFIL